MRIASTSSLVQLDVRTGAEGTTTTGSGFSPAAGSCDPGRFFLSSPPAAASLALTTSTAALPAASGSPAGLAALLGCCAVFLALSSAMFAGFLAPPAGVAGGFFLLKQRPMAGLPVVHTRLLRGTSCSDLRSSWSAGAEGKE